MIVASISTGKEITPTKGGSCRVIASAGRCDHQDGYNH